MANLLATKPLKLILDEAHETGEHSLKRALGVNNLIALGIGAIIGTGIFVLAGTATANFAGPAIILSFVLAATGCVFAGLCYAEFASAIPVAGSAYTYGYASLGEIFAWIIGWDLVLEYAFGAATVASGWSGYLLSLLGDFGIKLPASLAGTRWDEFIFYNNHWEPANLLMPKVQSGEIDITGLAASVRRIQPVWFSGHHDRDADSRCRHQGIGQLQYGNRLYQGLRPDCVCGRGRILLAESSGADGGQLASVYAAKHGRQRPVWMVRHQPRRSGNFLCLYWL